MFWTPNRNYFKAKNFDYCNMYFLLITLLTKVVVQFIIFKVGKERIQNIRVNFQQGVSSSFPTFINWKSHYGLISGLFS